MRALKGIYANLLIERIYIKLHIYSTININSYIIDMDLYIGPLNMSWIFFCALQFFIYYKMWITKPLVRILGKLFFNVTIDKYYIIKLIRMQECDQVMSLNPAIEVNYITAILIGNLKIMNVMKKFYIQQKNARIA